MNQEFQYYNKWLRIVFSKEKTDGTNYSETVWIFYLKKIQINIAGITHDIDNMELDHIEAFLENTLYQKKLNA